VAVWVWVCVCVRVRVCVPGRVRGRERGALLREPLCEPRLSELLGALLLDAPPPLARLEPLQPLPLLVGPRLLRLQRPRRCLRRAGLSAAAATAATAAAAAAPSIHRAVERRRRGGGGGGGGGPGREEGGGERLDGERVGPGARASRSPQAVVQRAAAAASDVAARVMRSRRCGKL